MILPIHLRIKLALLLFICIEASNCAAKFGSCRVQQIIQFRDQDHHFPNSKHPTMNRIEESRKSISSVDEGSDSELSPTTEPHPSSSSNWTVPNPRSGTIPGGQFELPLPSPHPPPSPPTPPLPRTTPAPPPPPASRE